MVSALIAGLGFVLGYVLLIRYELAVIPVVVAVIGILNAITVSEIYPGAVLGSMLSVVMLSILGFLGFRALRSVGLNGE